MWDKNISAGQDLLISTDGKIDGAMLYEKQQTTRSRHDTQKAAILTRRDRDKYCDWGGMA